MAPWDAAAWSGWSSPSRPRVVEPVETTVHPVISTSSITRGGSITRGAARSPGVPLDHPVRLDHPAGDQSPGWGSIRGVGALAEQHDQGTEEHRDRPREVDDERVHV